MADIEVDMVAELEVDLVAKVEVDKVADMEVDMVARLLNTYLRWVSDYFGHDILSLITDSWMIYVELALLVGNM